MQFVASVVKRVMSGGNRHAHIYIGQNWTCLNLSLPLLLIVIPTGPVAFVPVHASSDPDDDSDIYVYMEGPKVTTGAPRGKKVSPYHGNPTQPLAVPCKYWKNGNGVASLGYPPVTSARTGESHHSPHLNSQKLHSMQDRGIDG